MAVKKHMFRHVFKDGTAIELVVDLTQDEPRATSNVTLRDRPELADEFYEWSGTVAETIMPCLNEKQLTHFITQGFQSLE